MLTTIRKKIVRRIANRHVAGPEISDALKVCRWANNNGYSTILSPWLGNVEHYEDSGNNGLPDNRFEQFKATLEALHNEQIKGYMSIKLDAINYDFGFLRELLEMGKLYNIRIHIDSLAPDTAPITFRFLEKATDFNRFLGCTLPSRWRRSITDADRAVDLGVAVRVVKGQWDDPGGYVDCKKNYIDIIERLAGRARHVGVATHDKLLAERALEILSSSNTYCEFEQLFSLPLNGIEIARKSGCPYRVYVSYGQPAVPYNVRFMLKRPRIISWILVDYAFRFPKPWTNNRVQP